MYAYCICADFCIPKPPVKAEAWEGVRDATFFRNTCIEKERVGNEKLADQPDVTVGSEDCLYLNIYTPKHFSFFLLHCGNACFKVDYACIICQMTINKYSKTFLTQKT